MAMDKNDYSRSVHLNTSTERCDFSTEYHTEAAAMWEWMWWLEAATSAIITLNTKPNDALHHGTLGD